MSESQYFNIQQSVKLAEYLKKFDTPIQKTNNQVFNHSNDKKRKSSAEDDSKTNKLFSKRQDRNDKKIKTNLKLNQSKDERSDKLKNECIEKLMHSQFRNINQYLYENPTVQAIRYMTPDLFKKYHESYSELVKKWPVKPLGSIILFCFQILILNLFIFKTEVIINQIENLSSFNEKLLTIADMGCGEALLAKHFKETESKTLVHSFDLIDFNEHITKASIDNVPLEDNSCEIVVFCLSLMPTNIRDCIIEANRIMKKHALLYIAEVTSRFEDNNFKIFTNSMQQFGFKIKKQTLLQPDNYFVLFKFKKESPIEKLKGLPGINLKPCKYKTR